MNAFSTVSNVLPARPKTLEELCRPLLATLQATTGFESAYLTSIDPLAGVQRVLCAHNTGILQIDEGLQVPWADTLCRRALESGRVVNLDVAVDWNDSSAARELGIACYATEPVRTESGEVIGTLCVASTKPHSWPSGADFALTLFARLIGMHIERELALAQVLDAYREVARAALTDPLTGLPNRRTFDDLLARLWQRWRSEHGVLRLTFVDCDGFKQINDQYGHAVGDRFLIELAGRIRAQVRADDLVARLGGDEFAVLELWQADSVEISDDALARTIELATAGRYRLDAVEFDYTGASVGTVRAQPEDTDPSALVQRADQTMYEVKSQRRSRASNTRIGRTADGVGAGSEQRIPRTEHR